MNGGYRMNWLEEMTGVKKPIIAMCHFRALIGDTGFEEDSGGSIDNVVEYARRDMLALQNGGVDAIMFSNEFSLPYLTTVEQITPVCMARIIGEIKGELRVPFGVNVLWDPIASLDLAAATGAAFIREIISGVYASDFGIWNTNVGKTARHRLRLGIQDKVRMIYNIVPEAACYMGARSIEDIAKTTEFNCKPDAICVSGLTAGSPTDTQVLGKVRDTLKRTPLLCNTGLRIENAEELLRIADGAVVGTCFKIDGVFENFTDEKRVAQLMAVVRKIRG